MTALETRITNLEGSVATKFDLIIGKLHELDMRLTRFE